MSKPSAEMVRGCAKTWRLIVASFAGVSYLIVSSACVVRGLSG